MKKGFVVNTDATDIRRVLTNLIVNASSGYSGRFVEFIGLWAGFFSYLKINKASKPSIVLRRIK